MAEIAHAQSKIAKIDESSVERLNFPRHKRIHDIDVAESISSDTCTTGVALQCKTGRDRSRHLRL